MAESSENIIRRKTYETGIMKQDFDIKIAQTAEEIQAAMQLRREVFVGEEGVPEDKEFDGNDFVCCTHFYAKDKDNVIGCVRARFFPDFVKLERLCCRKEYRKTPLASQLMEYAYAFCEYKGYDKAVGYCTKSLLPYWQKSGFIPRNDIPVKKVGNMELYTIQRNLTPSANGISIERPETLLENESGMAGRDFVKRKALSIINGLKRHKEASTRSE